MSLSALHTIEHQLLMQLCDKHTLLSLARCSRSLLAAASCDFAFRFLSPISVDSRPDLGHLVSSSLLRFSDISLRSAAGELGAGAPYKTMLESIRSVPRLRELHCSYWIVSGDLSPLLSHDNMRKVTTLAVHSRGIEPAQLWLIAQHLPALRCLKLLEQAPLCMAGEIHALPDLVSLRDLHLTACTFEDLVKLGRSPLAARLEQLTLEQCAFDDSLTQSELRPTVLTTFVALRRITLIDPSPTLRVLDPALAQLTSLEVAVVLLTFNGHMSVPAAKTMQDCMQVRREAASANAAMVPCLIRLEIVQRGRRNEHRWASMLQSYEALAAESDVNVQFQLTVSSEQY